MAKTATLDDLRSWDPCWVGEDDYAARVAKIAGRRKRWQLAHVLALRGRLTDSDWQWLTHTFLDRMGYNCELRLAGCHYATRSLRAERKAESEPDKRSWEAVRVSKRYAHGRATAEELSAARAAAMSAAMSAARSAAWSAAWSARSAARSAGSAARSVAWSAAESAAWSVAEFAAESAARAAAGSGARSGESVAEFAARSAARAAAMSAAWSARSAGSAARSVAWSAAESAAWSVALSAELKAQCDWLQRTLGTA